MFGKVKLRDPSLARTIPERLSGELHVLSIKRYSNVLLTYLLTYLLHNKCFATLSFAIDRHVHRFSIPEITENMPAFLINLSVISPGNLSLSVTELKNTVLRENEPISRETVTRLHRCSDDRDIQAVYPKDKSDCS